MAGKGSFFGRLADMVIPGNAYNSTTGRWNPATTKTGIAGVIADQFVPFGSNIVGMAANGGLFGSDFADQLRNESTYNSIADQYADTLKQSQDYLHSIKPDVGYNPQVSVGTPQYMPQGWSGGSAGVPTMQPVEAQAPWKGLDTSTGNVFSGGMLGSWANGGSNSAPAFNGSYNAMNSNGLGFGSIGGGSTSLSNYGDVQMMAGVGSGGKNPAWSMDSWQSAMRKR